MRERDLEVPWCCHYRDLELHAAIAVAHASEAAAAPAAEFTTVHMHDDIDAALMELTGCGSQHRQSQ